MHGNLLITYITAYAPQAGRDVKLKQNFYKKLSGTFNSCSKNGPTVLLGDFNARVGKITSKAEATCAGKYAFLSEENLPSKFNEDVRTNRELFMDFCLQHSLIVTNTQYSKLPRYLYTFVLPGHEDDVLNKTTHFQVDYILVQPRWRNGITNVTAQPDAL